MNIRTAFTALAVMLLHGGVAQASLVSVDFEDPGVALASGTAAFGFGDYSVTSRGCTFTDTSNFFGGIENSVDGSSNGTTHLFGSSMAMSCGGVFDIITFDIGEDYLPDPIRFFVDLFYADGTSLLGASGTTDGTFGFQTLGNTSITSGLTSAVFYTTVNGSDGNPAQFALDNIVVRVPEPGTLGLLGLGLAGLGLARRRKTRR